MINRFYFGFCSFRFLFTTKKRTYSFDTIYSPNLPHFHRFYELNDIFRLFPFSIFFWHTISIQVSHQQYINRREHFCHLPHHVNFATKSIYKVNSSVFSVHCRNLEMLQWLTFSVHIWGRCRHIRMSAEWVVVVNRRPFWYNCRKFAACERIKIEMNLTWRFDSIFLCEM